MMRLLFLYLVGLLNLGLGFAAALYLGRGPRQLYLILDSWLPGAHAYAAAVQTHAETESANTDQPADEGDATVADEETVVEEKTAAEQENTVESEAQLEDAQLTSAAD